MKKRNGGKKERICKRLLGYDKDIVEDFVMRLEVMRRR